MQYYLINQNAGISSVNDLSALNTCKEFKHKISVSLPNNINNVLQIGIVTDRKIKDCHIVSSNLKAESGSLQNVITIFNSQGNDSFGHWFDKKIDLLQNEINILYIGVNLKDAEINATYKTHIAIDEFYGFDIAVTVDPNCEGTEYPSLCLINSRSGIDNAVANEYKRIEVDKNIIKLTAKDVEIGDSGLIANVYSYLNESVQSSKEIKCKLFSKPMQLFFDKLVFKFRQDKIVTDGYKAIIKSRGKNENLVLDIDGEIYYEGYFKYSIKVTALKDTILDNISLNSSFAACKYNMGLGKDGGNYQDIDYKWTDANSWDSIYVGNVNVGLKMKFTGENTARTLDDKFYNYRKITIPATWNNQQKGGIKVTKIDNIATLSAYIGNYVFVKDETICLTFEGNITPSKPINLKKQLATRILQNHDMKDPKKTLDYAIKNKYNYINVHYGNELNPFINAPGFADIELKKFIDKAHENNIGVNLYYTLNKLSTQTADYFPYNSFGNEIIARKDDKNTNSHNIDDRFIGSQYKIKGGKYNKLTDTAVLINPNSRYNNYYVEMVKYLTGYLGLDGLYLDGTIGNRLTIERVKKTLSARGIIDFSVSNRLEANCGNVSSLLAYSEVLPFVDSLWLGEGYNIKTSSEDFILTEMSGMLFGNMSKISQNPNDYHLAMLYGMVDKFSWDEENHNAALAICELIDNEELCESKFYGYWDSENPIGCNNPNVKISCYVKTDGRVVLDIYNFSTKTEQFDIGVNVKELGFETHDKIKRKIKIKNIQNGKKVDFDAKQSIKGNKGYFLVIKK